MTRTRITAALAALSTALLLSACDNTPADEAAKRKNRWISEVMDTYGRTFYR